MIVKSCGLNRCNIVGGLIFCFLLALSVLSWADSNWKAKKTEHFTVFYREGYEQNADELIVNLEHYREKVTKLTGNRDDTHSFFTLYDTGILPNGYYDPIFDRIGIFTYPPQKRFISSVENWSRMVGVHEYTHKMHITNTSVIPKMATTFFGTPFYPNLWTPGWVLEGIAVYSESSLSPYEGRLNDGYFSSYVKARAKEGRFPSLNTMTHSPFEYPPYENIYIYGGRFLQYLAIRYGEDRFSRFFSYIGGSIFSYLGPVFPYLGLDDAANSVYGSSIKKLFSEWRRYEKENAMEWRTEGERLTRHGWEIAYPILNQGKLYYVREYARKTGAYTYFNFCEIVARNLSSGAERVIVSLTSNIHTPLRIEGKKLYYGVFEIERGYKSSPFLGFGIVSSIYEKDLKTGGKRVLFKDEVRSFSPISSDEILYAKDTKNGFGSSVFLYSKKENKKRLLFTTSYLISEILPTREGIFAVARKNWENWGIYRLEIEEGILTPVIDTPFNEANISFDGDKLYFVANYERNYRIYAYDLKEKRLFRLTENGYADYPIVDSKGNRLYFVGLTSEGFDIFCKGLDLKGVAIPEYEKSKIPTFFTLKAQEVGYAENLKTLLPKVHIPFPVGIFLMGGDAVGENQYILMPYLDVNSTKDQDVRLGLVAIMSSNFFKPSIFYLGFANDESLNIGWKYPLLMRLAPGLSNLTVSLEAGRQDKFKEKYITPGIGIGLRFPRWDANLLTRYYVGSETAGLRISSSLRRYISNSHLKLLADYDYQKKITPRTSNISVDNLLTLEYSLPLFKIRRGSWNPNIYFEDLSCLFFAEGSFEDSHYGVGVELKQEVSLFLGNIKFPIHLGCGINKDGKGTVYWGLGRKIMTLFKGTAVVEKHSNSK
ncbi:MAG: hypothetical protein QME40_02100, partial [bacterium]|nr:hypothetical protein [bacterium]